MSRVMVKLNVAHRAKTGRKIFVVIKPKKLARFYSLQVLNMPSYTLWKKM